MFENEFLERFSRIHPSTPFIVWIPVVLFFLGRSVVRHDLPIPVIVLACAGGTLAWTLAEYVLHRYIFHWTNDTSWGRRVHFLLHGVHHDFPNDKDRLVMPLPTSVPLGLIFFTLFHVLLGRWSEPFFAGFVVGYLFYDGTHYYVHHFIPTTRWGKFLRRHHLTHHHADHHGGFGVSSPLWDLVFRSIPRKRS